ncbi:hypothetical protein ACFO4O_03170 [Glaciecola siphonariae]|uniref:Uncharacterized protein n=1 Tax=Glaciecola siphonariae TaxID=521012 RepID=A0ABV9LTI1_9ALTE
MSKLDKDSVIEKFTAAYKDANGKAPSIEAKGGWYSVDGGKNIRLAQLDEMADELGKSAGKAKAAPAEKKAAKKPAAKAAEPKAAPAAKEKKPAPKKAAKKPKKAPGSFSVKDFYTQQILEANPGSKAPR